MQIIGNWSKSYNSSVWRFIACCLIYFLAKSEFSVGGGASCSSCQGGHSEELREFNFDRQTEETSTYRNYHRTRFSKTQQRSTKMENMSNKENLFFDPSTGKLCTSKPANDKAIAVDMNRQGSGGFFAFTAKGTRHDFIRCPKTAADLECLNVHCIMLN